MADQLTVRLQRMEKDFEDMKKEFMSDGKLSRDELMILKSVQTKLQAFRKKVVEHNEKKGIIDFSDEPEVVTVAQKEYDDASFKTAFNQSIRDWSQDGNIALNRVKTYFIKSDGPAGIGAGDVLTVVGIIFSSNPAATAVIGAIKTATSLVEAAYKASLPATPSLNDIHSSWAVALQKYGTSNHDKEYEDFVKAWKKANGIPADVTKVPTNTFLPACAGYGNKYLPRAADVEKAFITKVLKNVKDGWDIDLGGGLDKAGVCEVEMVHLVGNFSQPKGQLDDVSEQLLEAVRTVWKNHKVVDLPVQLYFRMNNVNGANMCEIQRDSRKAGDTSFKLRSGDKAIYDAFMKEKAWNLVRVSQLKYDGV